MFLRFLLGAVASKYNKYSLVRYSNGVCMFYYSDIYNYILDHDRDRQNAAHRLLVHVPGATRQDNVAIHIPNLKN